MAIKKKFPVTECDLVGVDAMLVMGGGGIKIIRGNSVLKKLTF